MLLGIRGINPRRRDFVAHLETLVTATGEPLPPHTRQALTREYERLCVSQRQIKEIEATQAAAIQGTSEKAASLTEEGRGGSGIDQAALLLRLRGLGQIGASVLSREVLYRRFDNRREVASYFGLTPSPYNSGSMRTDQGIGKAGNPRARTMAIELAWLWVRHQPESALIDWFLERVGNGTGRIRRIAIVALARKLMIALWRYVTIGMIPVPVGPVTAKLCKSAKGARDAEMGLHPAQLWTESAFGKQLGPKVVAIATTLTGVQDPLDRRSVKSSPLRRRTSPGLLPAREMARTHTFAVTGPLPRARRHPADPLPARRAGR